MDEPLLKQAARAAYGWGRAQDWQEALYLLECAAEAGEPDARRQLELVTQGFRAKRYPYSAEALA